MRPYIAAVYYSNSSFDNVNRGLEWNNNMDGTYRYWIPGKGNEYRQIPHHDHIREIYDFVFHYAMDEYMNSGTFEKCLALVEEKYGKMSQEMIDYLKACPYDAGDRAGLLREEPDHYE